MTKQRILALAAALCVGTAALPAMAASDQADPVRVYYGDLDLASAAGQEQLDRRIDAAARKSCKADIVPAGYRGLHPTTRSCIINAKASAAKQVAEVMADKARRG